MKIHWYYWTTTTRNEDEYEHEVPQGTIKTTILIALWFDVEEPGLWLRFQWMEWKKVSSPCNLNQSKNVWNINLSNAEFNSNDELLMVMANDKYENYEHSLEMHNGNWLTVR